MWNAKRPVSIAVMLLGAAVVAACAGKQQTDTQSSRAPMTQATTAAAVQPTAAAAAEATTAAAPAVAPSVASAAVAASLASSDGEQPGTRVVVNSLKRGPNTLTLRFTLQNDSPAQIETGGDHFGGPDYLDTRNVSGIFLIDAAAKKKYFVVADTDKHCICSEHVDDVPPKSAMTLWAQFPAPPDTVKKITVNVPHFQPLDDVPISG